MKSGTKSGTCRLRNAGAHVPATSSGLRQFFLFSNLITLSLLFEMQSIFFTLCFVLAFMAPVLASYVPLYRREDGQVQPTVVTDSTVVDVTDTETTPENTQVMSEMDASLNSTSSLIEQLKQRMQDLLTFTDGESGSQTCWRQSIDRGYARPIHTCGYGQEKSGLLCYFPCAPEFKGFGPLCVSSNGTDPVWRGVGDPMQCDQETEDNVFGLCYKKCPEGSFGFMNKCVQTCPDFLPFQCTKSMCTKDVQTCAKSLFKVATAGLDGVKELLMNDDGDDAEDSLETDQGEFKLLKPMAFLSQHNVSLPFVNVTEVMVVPTCQTLIQANLKSRKCFRGLSNCSWSPAIFFCQNSIFTLFPLSSLFPLFVTDMPFIRF